MQLVSCFAVGVWKGTEVLRRVDSKKAPLAAGNTMPSTTRAQALSALQFASAPPERPTTTLGSRVVAQHRPEAEAIEARSKCAHKTKCAATCPNTRSNGRAHVDWATCRQHPPEGHPPPRHAFRLRARAHGDRPLRAFSPSDYAGTQAPFPKGDRGGPAALRNDPARAPPRLLRRGDRSADLQPPHQLSPRPRDQVFHA